MKLHGKICKSPTSIPPYMYVSIQVFNLSLYYKEYCVLGLLTRDQCKIIELQPREPKTIVITQLHDNSNFMAMLFPFLFIFWLLKLQRLLMIKFYVMENESIYFLFVILRFLNALYLPFLYTCLCVCSCIEMHCVSSILEGENRVLRNLKWGIGICEVSDVGYMNQTRFGFFHGWIIFPDFSFMFCVFIYSFYLNNWCMIIVLKESVNEI